MSFSFSLTLSNVQLNSIASKHALSAGCDIWNENITFNFLKNIPNKNYSFVPLQIRSSAAATPPKLVTVLGKGGSGKTTASVLLAKYYAESGRKTCLLVQSTDRVADDLLNQRLSSQGTQIQDSNLTAFRIESTKLLKEPLELLKKADARSGFSQGMLEEVAENELSVLPGMDLIFSAAMVEKTAKPGGGLLSFFDMRGASMDASFDVVVYDGASSADTLRLLGTPERARWYLRRFRALAEKTDMGRVSLPTIARIIESTIKEEGEQAARTSAEVWEYVERILTRAVDSFSNPSLTSCYLVARADSKSSVDTAMRFWGSAMQAGARVSGALLSFSHSSSSSSSIFEPLPVAHVPWLEEGKPPDWKKSVSKLKESAGKLLEGESNLDIPDPVVMDSDASTISLFLPGFEKGDVKLSQWKGGSELLIDAGDQRRSILVPPQMRGEVVGAKFQKKSLTITLKK